MAIFNNGDSTHKSTSADANTTIITAGSAIKGEMNLACNLYVDGEFEGTIHSTKEVNIGKHGHISGDVFTTRLVVQGYIEGNISANRVEIKAHGRVNGMIESSELVIEAKGIFEGSSIVKDVAAVPTKTAFNDKIPTDTIKSVLNEQEVKVS